MAAIDIITRPDTNPVDLQKWAEFTIFKWQALISKHKLIQTGDLLRSFEYVVKSDSGGNASLIQFAFNYYMRMLDMGVGRGNSYGNSNRKKYPVFTREFRHQVYRLAELYAQMYANQAAAQIIGII